MKSKVLISLFFFLIYSSPAYAYLDGGSINIITQLIIAGVAGLGAVIKIYWSYIKAFLAKMCAKVFGKKAKKEASKKQAKDE